MLCLVVRNPPELAGKGDIPECGGEQEWFDELKMQKTEHKTSLEGT